MILRILSNHSLDNPCQVDIPDIGIGYIFSIPKNCNMIPNLKNFLQPVGNINDGNSIGNQFSHNPEQDINLCCRQRRCRFIHDQHFQVILNKVAGDLDHLLLPHSQISDQRIRIDIVLQSLHHRFCAFSMFVIVQKQAFLLFMSHKDILVHRQIRKKAQFLMDNTDAPRSGCIGILKNDFPSVHVHFAGARLLDSRNHFHQGGFPGTVLTNQYIHLPFEKVKGNLVQCLCAGVNLIYLFAMENNIRVIKHKCSSFYSIVSSTGTIIIASLAALRDAPPVNVTFFPAGSLLSRSRGSQMLVTA